MNREFRNLRTGIKDLTREKKNEFPAYLGNKSGVVIVSGNIVNILTIPEGIPLQVVNRNVYNRPGAIVMVGKRDGSNSLEVLYELNNNSAIPLSNDNVLSSLPEHAQTHQYPSYDTIFIKNFQFLPLLCLPVSGHIVRVFPGTVAKINSTGLAYCVGDTALDLSADVPASGACWEVIQVEDDGTLSLVTGPTETDRATVEASDLPATAYKPIWAIVLSSEYGELEASNSRNDFWDLRFANFPASVDAVNVIYTPINYSDWDFYLDPGDAADALDQIAERVRDLEIGSVYGGGGGLYASYAKLADEKATTTNGGTFTQGAWQTRDIAEKIDPDNIVIVSGNQITLGTGTYRVIGFCPAYSCGHHQARLYNITNGTVLIVGTSEYAANSDSTVSSSKVVGRFTLSGTKVLELQHRCAATQATTGFGGANGFGLNEVYSVLEIWKES